MSVSDKFLSNLEDILTFGQIEKIFSRVKSSIIYQSVDKNLNKGIDSFSNDIKILLLSSINVAVYNFDDIKIKKIVKINIKKNMELILEWVVSPNELEFIEESKKIYYDLPDHKKELKRAMNSLFHGIQKSRKKYFTIQISQIQNAVTKIDEQNVDIYKIVQKMSEDLNDIKKEWSFSDELLKISEFFNNRNFKEARSMAFHFEDKIVQNNKMEEIEKLYQVIVNSFIGEALNQGSAIEYLKKLILYTGDNDKKHVRTILLHILEKKYYEAQILLNEMLSNKQKHQIEKKIYQLQNNIYFAQKKYIEANEFLDMIKDEYEDFPFWKVELHLIKYRYNEAYSILEMYKEYFSSTEFNIQLKKFEVEYSKFVQEIMLSFNVYEVRDKTIMLLKNVNELISNVGQDDFTLSNLFCHKAQLHGYIGEYEQADALYKRVENIYPENIYLLRNYPVILMNSDSVEKNRKANMLLKQYLKIQEEDEVVLRMYYYSLMQYDPDECIIQLEEYSKQKEKKLSIQTIIVEAYDKKIDTSNAKKHIDRLLKSYPKNEYVLFSSALHKRKCKDVDNAIIEYEKVLGLAEKREIKSAIISELVNIYYQKNNHVYDQKLIKLLENHYLKNEILTMFGSPYTEVLLRLEQYNECLECCDTILKKSGGNAEYIRREGLCYFGTENYSFAIDSFDELIRQNKFDYKDLKYYVNCFISLGEIEKAKNIIPRMNEPATIDDYLALNYFLLTTGEIKKALENIKTANNRFPHNQQLMEMYITINIQYDGASENTLQVECFNKCLEEYKTANFDNKVLFELEIPKQLKGQELLDHIASVTGANSFRDTSNIETIIDDLENKHLPISFLKGSNAKNYFYIWHEVINNPNFTIWSAWGNNRDVDEIKYVNSDKIYIDLSSLLTLDFLNLLDMLPELFDTIFITQSIYSEIQHLIHECKNFATPMGSLIFNKENQVQYFGYQKSFFKKIERSALRINKVIKENMNTFIIIGESITSTKEIHETFQKMLKLSYMRFDFDCIVDSYKNRVPIMLENTFMRELFHLQKDNPGCFGIIALLIRIANEKKWDNKYYYAILSKLIMQNYKYFKLDVNLFIETMKIEGYQVTEKVKCIFSLLSDSAYENTGILKIIVSLLLYIWLEVSEIKIKKAWTEYILDIYILRPEIQKESAIDMCFALSQYIVNIESVEGLKDFIEGYLK